MHLALHRHIAPLRDTALGLEVALDRPDLAVFQFGFRADERMRGGDVDSSRAERRVLHAMTQQLVRKLRIRELQARGSLDKVITVLKRTGVDVDSPLVVHGWSHASGQGTDGQVVGRHRRRPLRRTPVGIRTDTGWRPVQTQPLQSDQPAGELDPDGMLELQVQRLTAVDGERVQLPVEEAL